MAEDVSLGVLVLVASNGTFADAKDLLHEVIVAWGTKGGLANVLRLTANQTCCTAILLCHWNLGARAFLSFPCFWELLSLIGNIHSHGRANNHKGHKGRGEQDAHGEVCVTWKLGLYRLS